MHNITLIGTVHKEAGSCTAQGFYQILEAIRPQVIFEELMPSDFDAHYNLKTRSQLETKAVNAYAQNHSVEHIPVDLDFLPPTSFFELHRTMHERVEAISLKYQTTIDTDAVNKRMYGFRYLNSPHSEKMTKDLNDAVEEALRIIDQEEFMKIHKSWNEHMRKREATMMANMYSYFGQKPFESAVFYIGAGHRSFIKQLIQDYETNQKTDLKWNHDNYQGIM